jgi:hypothetical protein
MRRLATVIGMCLMVTGLTLVFDAYPRYATAQEYHYPKPKGNTMQLPEPNWQAPLVWQQGKVARNGQCPVCGEMAPTRGFVQAGTKNCKLAGEYLMSCEYNMVDPGPGIVRCRRCNAAFWIDSEPEPVR